MSYFANLANSEATKSIKKSSKSIAKYFDDMAFGIIFRYKFIKEEFPKISKEFVDYHK
jgi:hypothetical protein